MPTLVEREDFLVKLFCGHEPKKGHALFEEKGVITGIQNYVS